MPSSSHQVPVIEVKLESHPNADKLALVRVDDMRVVGVRKEEWKDGDLGAFIQADMVVPEAADFAWLGKDRRIRPRKFRGVMSWGLLVHAPEGSQVGDDVAERMGIVRYAPPEEAPGMDGECEKAPRMEVPKYDLESWYKYHHLLEPGETVVITEKLHGANSRFVFWDGEMHVGSRTTWKRENEGNMFWRAFYLYPQIEVFCRSHPGHIVYGEIFGQVQDLKYGAVKNELYFRVFDVLAPENYVPGPEGNYLHEDSMWWTYSGMLCCTGMPVVPLVYKGPYDRDKVAQMVEGNTLLAADHMREGIVISPTRERWSEEIGRVKLKAVSMDYLERRK